MCVVLLFKSTYTKIIINIINRKSELRETLCNTEKKLVDACHLSEEELKFFEDWLFVINSETEVVEKKFNDKTIWTRTPAERYIAYIINPFN